MIISNSSGPACIVGYNSSVNNVFFRQGLLSKYLLTDMSNYISHAGLVMINLNPTLVLYFCLSCAL